MSEGIFSKNYREAGTDTDPLKQAFSWFDKWEKGLCARLMQFVRDGTGRPVLEALLVAPRPKLLRPRDHQKYLQEIKQELEREGRLFALVQYCGDQPEALARYVEVLSSALRGRFSKINQSSYAPNELPDSVTDLFNFIREANAEGQDEYKPATVEASTTFEDVLKVIKIFGGTSADVVTVALPSQYPGQLCHFTLEGKSASQHLCTLTVAEFVTSLERRPVRNLSKILLKLSDFPIVKDPAFLDYLINSATSKSAQVRLAAQDLLQHQSDENIVAKAIPMLDAKSARIRSSAVQILGIVKSDAALEAMSARAKIEKSQDVLTAITLFTETSNTQALEVPDGRYLAADGSIIEVPDFEPLVEADTAPFGSGDLAMLKAADEKETEHRMEWHHRQLNALKPGTEWKPTEPERLSTAGDLFAFLNTPMDVLTGKEQAVKQGEVHRNRPGVPWYQRSLMTDLAGRLSDWRLVQLALVDGGGAAYPLSHAASSPIAEQLNNRIQDGAIDIRQVFLAADKSNYVTDVAQYLSGLLHRTNPARPPAILPQTWPITANNLDQVLEALPPQTLKLEPNLNALQLLKQMPKLPMVAVDKILFAALDERRLVHDLAQTLLMDVEGINQRIIATLADKRQIVRSKAARLLADRGARQAVPSITKRLKVEKSEGARAELISALSRLGGDTKPYLGRAALVKEAQSLVKKLPNAKIDWLQLEAAPALRWADGKHVDPVVPDAWLRLALKLKSPAESSLFDLYYEQLDTRSAMEFGDWVLASWIAYDAFELDESGMRERAEKLAEVYKTSRGRPWTNKTIEQIVGHLMYQWTTRYPNSGNDAKGVLALTHHATPTSATTAIAAYLKNHGKRVSQAKCLVEVLAAMATPEAVQVLVATATRFKQRGVRQFADTCVSKIAEECNWTEDELADRSIPSGGIGADGILTLEVGELRKPYIARLGSDLSVKLFNPEGKEVKAIPAGQDEITKKSKKLLSGTKKTIKTVVTHQSTRLYDAMVGARQWTLTDWETNVVGHPIMMRLTERVIWRAVAKEGSVVALFRPSPEGVYLTADGEDADLSAAVTIDIAHTTTVEEDTRQAWLTHLDDFEIIPLFAQISRPMRVLDAEDEKLNAIEERKGWLTETFKLRSATTKAGFERGPIEDGGRFHRYLKTFRNASIRAELNFTGSSVPENDIPAAIIGMKFFKVKSESDRWQQTPLTLSAVPAIVLFEAWYDLHDIASVGYFDEDWQKKCLY